MMCELTKGSQGRPPKRKQRAPDIQPASAGAKGDQIGQTDKPTKQMSASRESTKKQMPSLIS